jgi:hypothetical protein
MRRRFSPERGYFYIAADGGLADQLTFHCQSCRDDEISVAIVERGKEGNHRWNCLNCEPVENIGA